MAEPDNDFDLEQIVSDLMRFTSLDEYRALLRQHPQLTQDPSLALIDEFARIDGFGTIFHSIGELLRGSRVSPAPAWASFLDRRSKSEELAAEVETGTKAVEAASLGRRFTEVIELADRLLPIARAAGLGLSVAHLEDLRGQALVQMGPDDRVKNIEDAIKGLSRAVRAALDRSLRARALTHLALAYGERIRGDRAENLELAVRLLREALDELDSEAEPDTNALIQTNLGAALIRSEHGDRVENLREAVDVLRLALTFRSPRRNADDWAYTHINLGDALALLAGLGAAEQGKAAEAFETVIAERDRLNQPWLVGAAHHAIGRLERSLANHSPEDYAAATDAESADWEASDHAHLVSARDHLRAAKKFSRTGPDRIRHAQVLSDLAATLQRLGEGGEAISAARESLGIVGVASDPPTASAVGGTLGSLLADGGDWAEAAHAFRTAAEASEFGYHSRLETSSREREAKNAGNLHRWAAMAIARAGEALEAALVLESGRTRELRRRFALDPQVAELPDAYREAYEGAVQALAGSPTGPAAADAGRALQQVLAEIRSLPGFDRFATGPRYADLAAAAENQIPVIYVNPTPWGTLLLWVALADEGGVTVDQSILGVTSTEVFMRLAVGAADLEEAARRERLSSYLGAISGEPAADLFEGLDNLLPWLGETVAKPIAEMLAKSGACGATLVLCGPISTAPLHAAAWTTRNGSRRLIDEFAVRYAPSATFISRSLDQIRMHESLNPVLVALADPRSDLPAAQTEVDEITTQFRDRAICAYGEEATWRFLSTHAGTATHLHLACHARGGLFDERQTGLEVSDAFLTLDQLSEVTGLTARLAVISACQTAMVDINNLPDEGLSIGAVMVAAGSACAIASLWPVNDEATALLMIRMYEELLGSRLAPPEALRRAQLWLENLTVEARVDFLARHKLLAGELARRGVDTGTSAIRNLASSSKRESPAPYRHPFYWAGFVATGA